MNGASLLPLFLLAVAGGFIAARPDADPDRPLWRGGIGALPAIMQVGAVIAAAESGSASARYLALFAVLIASVAAVLLVGVPERRWPPIAPAEDDAGEDDA